MDKIYIRDTFSWQEKVDSINGSLILGFQAQAAKFPITTRDSTKIDRSYLSDLSKLCKLPKMEYPLDYKSSTKAAEPIEDLDWRPKKGLENLFQKGYLLLDRNNDQLADDLDFKIRIPKDCDVHILEAACNLAYRFGMETTAFSGSLVAEEDWQGNIIEFVEAPDCQMSLEENADRIMIFLSGQGQELVDFISHICNFYPLLPNGRTWVDHLQDMTDSFAMQNLDGQLTYLASMTSEEQRKARVFASPDIDENIEKLEKYFSSTDFVNHRADVKVYEKFYDLPWEVDTFKRNLRDQLYPSLKRGDRVEIYGALSEPREIRQELVDEISSEMERFGAVIKEFQVISAYKQGFSWIDEIVLPSLKGRKIDRVEIAFKVFLPEGETQWLDEAGATPSYNIAGKDDPEKWLDLPIRFLQELYPVDDLLAMELDLNRDDIVFLPYEGEEDITYKVRVFAEGREEEFSYRAAYSERPYMDDFPGMGKVHPSTGYLRILLNGKELVNSSIKTDLENVWDIYQTEVLRDCRAYIDEKTGGNPQLELQPFFSQLRIHLELSEPEYSLPFRQDMISSLNALHEDLYFVGSDYFKNYGLEKANAMLDAPGLILPILKARDGRPKFRVELCRQIEDTPCIKLGEEEIRPDKKRQEIELYIDKILYKKGDFGLSIASNLEEVELLEAYLDLLEKGLLQASKQLDKVDFISLNANGFEKTIQLWPYEELVKDLNIREIDLMEDRLIGYKDYMEIIDQLKRVEGIGVYQMAKSYLGRKVYAIEILPREEGYVSRVKRISNLPSEIINARHHANEVSSTNAALILLKKILTEDKYRDLPDRMNLVVMPMENVDGTEIHYELQKDNPHWKLHVARFNAIGKEFYHEHFKPDTIHTEAMALTRLWERFLPDVIVDNHGVPSHEWDQQFSGYTSPSFKGFWLPRSLLYGYFWYVTDEVYSGNYGVNKKMEALIAKAIAENEEMTGWNQEWIPIFEKYAHKWMPKLFPADYFNNMINYWIPFEYDPLHRYPSIRFPWITTVAYTSEVADETAQGTYLNLCARTHVAHDEAVLEMLMGAELVFESDFELREDGLSLLHIRQRPILV